MEALYTKLVQANENINVPVDEFIKELLNSIESVFNDSLNISMTFDIESFDPDTSKMFPLGMIINELVTNSIQHGYNEKSSMNIYLSLKKLKALFSCR